MQRTLVTATILVIVLTALVSTVREAKAQAIDDAMRDGLATHGIMAMQEYHLLYGTNPCQHLMNVRRQAGIDAYKVIVRQIYQQLLHNQIVGKPVELELTYGNAFDQYLEEMADADDGVTYGGCRIHIITELLRDRRAVNDYKAKLDDGTMPDWLMPIE